MYDKYHALVRDAFDMHPLFVKALEDGCIAFVNENAITKAAKKKEVSAELIAKYCDALLKKGAKDMRDDAEFEHLLDKIIVVFKVGW